MPIQLVQKTAQLTFFRDSMTTQFIDIHSVQVSIHLNSPMFQLVKLPSHPNEFHGKKLTGQAQAAWLRDSAKLSQEIHEVQGTGVEEMWDLYTYMYTYIYMDL